MLIGPHPYSIDHLPESARQQLGLREQLGIYDETNIPRFEPSRKTEFSFADLLDVINPLQHIPIVSTIYRAITGDSISPAARIAGGTLFGGPIGALAAGVTMAAEHVTGLRADDQLARVFGREPAGQTEPPMQMIAYGHLLGPGTEPDVLIAAAPDVVGDADDGDAQYAERPATTAIREEAPARDGPAARGAGIAAPLAMLATPSREEAARECRKADADEQAADETDRRNEERAAAAGLPLAGQDTRFFSLENQARRSFALSPSRGSAGGIAGVGGMAAPGMTSVATGAAEMIAARSKSTDTAETGEQGKRQASRPEPTAAQASAVTAPPGREPVSLSQDQADALSAFVNGQPSHPALEQRDNPDWFAGAMINALDKYQRGSRTAAGG